MAGFKSAAICGGFFLLFCDSEASKIDKKWNFQERPSEMEKNKQKNNRVAAWATTKKT